MNSSCLLAVNFLCCSVLLSPVDKPLLKAIHRKVSWRPSLSILYPTSVSFLTVHLPILWSCHTQKCTADPFSSSLQPSVLLTVLCAHFWVCKKCICDRTSPSHRVYVCFPNILCFRFVGFEWRMRSHLLKACPNSGLPRQVQTCGMCGPALKHFVPDWAPRNIS